jgi:hypothetical protein
MELACEKYTPTVDGSSLGPAFEQIERRIMNSLSERIKQQLLTSI